MTRMLLGFLLLLALPAARAANWDPDAVELPSSSVNSFLSRTGRAAVLDPENRVHLVAQVTVTEDVFRVEYYRRDPDGSWSVPEVISTVVSARNASLGLDPDGGLHAVWEDITTSQGEIRYRHRTPEGTWDPAITLSSRLGISSDPTVAVDVFGRVHTTWIEGSAGFPQLVYRRLETDGTWTPEQVLSVGGIAPQNPSMHADGLGFVHLVWNDRVGNDRPTGFFNNEIFYLRIGPEPEPALEPVRLTNNINVSVRPFVESTAEGNVHVVWLDNRNLPGDRVREIYYRRYLHGVGWGHVKRFTYDEADHDQPVLVAGADQTLNVVWEDFRHGNAEIFYRQVTRPFGWEPQASRLTVDGNPSIRPTILAGADGRLVLLWTDGEEGSSSSRLFVRDGSVAF